MREDDRTHVLLAVVAELEQAKVAQWLMYPDFVEKAFPKLADRSDQWWPIAPTPAAVETFSKQPGMPSVWTVDTLKPVIRMLPVIVRPWSKSDKPDGPPRLFITVPFICPDRQEAFVSVGSFFNEGRGGSDLRAFRRRRDNQWDYVGSLMTRIA